MWLNNINGRCYIGSSINLYSRMNNYLSPYYISRTKNKMAICSSINKYGIEQFSFAILEKIELDNTVELKEVNPSPLSPLRRDRARKLLI